MGAPGDGNVDAAGWLPAVPYLRTGAGGDPHLEGQRCGSCGTIFLEPRPACAKCFSRAPMEKQRLADRGTVYNATIVYRNFPGVEVPFISVIVDLDGGGVVRGNLRAVKPDPAKLPFGMRVKLGYGDAGRTDADGKPYLAYFFLPEDGEVTAL